MGKHNESMVDYWLTDDGLTLLAAWKRDGLTIEKICERIGINRHTMTRWQNDFPEIKEALSRGKELVDYMVENALLKAALGYTTKEIKVTLGKKAINGEVFTVLKETTTKHVGPNAVACLAWLNNRKHEQWKRNRDNCVEYNEEDSNVTVKIIRGKGGTKNVENDSVEPEVNEGVEIKIPDRKPKRVLEDGTVEGEKNMDYWPEDFEEE